MMKQKTKVRDAFLKSRKLKIEFFCVFYFVVCCVLIELISKDYFDEGNPPMSPRDTLKEASDVLSILSGHGGGIKVR